MDDVTPEHSPGCSSGDRKLLLEQYRMARANIEECFAETERALRNAIILSLAAWSWMLSHPAHMCYLSAALTCFVTILGARAYADSLVIGREADYMRGLERASKLPPELCRELYLEEKRKERGFAVWGGRVMTWQDMVLSASTVGAFALVIAVNLILVTKNWGADAAIAARVDAVRKVVCDVSSEP